MALLALRIIVVGLLFLLRLGWKTPMVGIPETHAKTFHIIVVE